MALIPQGTHAGRVLVWDPRGGCNTPPSPPWYQRWALLDCSGPYPVVLHNGELPQSQVQDGDLFCSGHAWTEDGRLFVAGGTTDLSFPQAGNKLAFLFDPTITPYGGWIRAPDMAKDRWYPSVTRSSENMMVVFGGSQTPINTNLLLPENTTEHFFPSLTSPYGLWRVNPATPPLTWFQGPANPPSVLGLYPRIPQLANQKFYLAGDLRQTALVDIVLFPEVWNAGQNSIHDRHDGAALIYPDPHGQLQRVMILGGSSFGHSVVHDRVEICTPLGAGAWSTHSTLKKKRVHLNAVLLPDASIVAIGGNGEGNPIDTADYYHSEPERLAFGATSWELLAPSASERDYHSTAVLLRDGRVLTGGGDNRTWDYQIFSPPYFDVVQPDEAAIRGIALSATTWNYRSLPAGPYAAMFDALDPSVSVARVVLMSPGSTTHHSDFDQRYVDLQIVAGSQTSTSVAFWPPWDRCIAPSAGPTCAPRGFYMVFLISSLGVPYGAGFIRLV